MRVCISTATRNSVHWRTHEWILREFVRMAPHVEVQTITTPNLEAARNEQVWRFLDSTCTHLYIVDSDVIPPGGVVQKLLAYDLSIIASPHTAIKVNETGLVVLDRVDRGYVQHYPLDGLQRCDAVGCTGLMIRRDVFEVVEPPWFHFVHNARGDLAQGEDFYFCERAQQAGYEIWAQCDLVQRHAATVIL